MDALRNDLKERRERLILEMDDKLEQLEDQVKDIEDLTDLDG
jgi:hypothetical protein